MSSENAALLSRLSLQFSQSLISLSRGLIQKAWHKLSAFAVSSMPQLSKIGWLGLLIVQGTDACSCRDRDLSATELNCVDTIALAFASPASSFPVAFDKNLKPRQETTQDTSLTQSGSPAAATDVVSTLSEPQEPVNSRPVTSAVYGARDGTSIITSPL